MSIQQNGRAFLLTNKHRRRKYKHELTNGWITCRGNSFWHLCARSRGAALHARQSDRCHLSDTDGGKLGGAHHRRRTLHLAADTLFHPRRLRTLQDRSDGPALSIVLELVTPGLDLIGSHRSEHNESNGGNGACR